MSHERSRSWEKIHIVAIPHEQDSLAKAIGRTHLRYTQYINRFHHRSGHLWEERFYSCALDERHFWLAMKYIELNPVRARLYRKPWRYAWSSSAGHVDTKAVSIGYLALSLTENLLECPRFPTVGRE